MVYRALDIEQILADVRKMLEDPNSLVLIIQHDDGAGNINIMSNGVCHACRMTLLKRAIIEQIKQHGFNPEHNVTPDDEVEDDDDIGPVKGHG